MSAWYTSAMLLKKCCEVYEKTAIIVHEQKTNRFKKHVTKYHMIIKKNTHLRDSRCVRSADSWEAPPFAGDLIVGDSPGFEKVHSSQL